MKRFKEIVSVIVGLLILIIIIKLYINFFQFFDSSQFNFKTYVVSYLMWLPFSFVLCLAPMIYWKDIYNIYDFFKALIVVILVNLMSASFSFLF